MTLLPELGKYPEFILAAYGVSLFVLACLIGWIRLDARAQLKTLDELEAQGVRRRSKKTPARK